MSNDKAAQRGHAVQGHQHRNPYHPVDERAKHEAFEAAWSKKTTWGNIKGVFEKYQIERENRVKQRVEAYFSRRNSFVASNELPLQGSYAGERDRQNHPYTGWQGRGQHVEYLDRGTDRRNDFAVKFNGGVLQGEGIKTPHQNDPIAPDQLGPKKVMFTRRGSNADNLLAMIKESQVGNDDQNPQKKRTQHSTFNSGLSVANAGFLELGADKSLQRVKLSSGHYAPDEASGVKLAVWAEVHGAFNPDQVPIEDHSGKRIDVSTAARINAVSDWAKRNPKP
jgi:hypothetical protein